MTVTRFKAKLLASLLLLPAIVVASLRPALAATCATESQMTSAQRDAIVNAARDMATQIQRGSVIGLRSNTLPAVAAQFDGIAAAVNNLLPLIQHASITIDEVYDLDASTEAANSPRTEFFCGSPVVMMTFNSLPPGKYALAFVHATGVPKPQQIALILALEGNSRWLLAGFQSKPMTEDGHDGLWYWVAARNYAHQSKKWDAWIYYHLASDLLDPAEFVSSPHLQKLQHETDEARPDGFPEPNPVNIISHGTAFQIVTVGTTTTFGPLDLDVHYAPDAAQAAQLRDPQSARKQVLDVMNALLSLHPELRDAFHGIWVHADSGNATLFALELPMSGIAGSPVPASAQSTNAPMQN
jgi:hypothetical protein